jgi:peptidoglycan hydrolase-like protein with peptidoglycan-binding domain
MSKFMTAACAFALALAWATAPAAAQTTAPTTEQKADQIEKKAEQKADQIENKAKQDAKDVRKEGDRAADQVRGKTDSDTAGGKVDRAWDKTKAKAREVKDKVTGNGDARGDGDVRSAQMALRDKGHNPGPIDGVMGPRTSAAVREFQQKENLTVSGQLDAETRAKLMAGASTSSTTSTDAGKSTSAGTPSTSTGAAGSPAASPATTDKAGRPQSQKQ